MYVKYCGFTRQQDVQVACDCEVDAIGFIMYPPSARYVDLTTIKQLTESVPESIDRVAVTVNMPLYMIEKLLNETRINTVQLHGNEPVSYIKYLKAKYPHIQIFKALQGTESLKQQFLKFEPYVDKLLVDTPTEAYGGAGTTFDWRVLTGVPLDKALIAGGLNQETLSALLKQVPHVNGIDIASGIESERKGYKSKDKMIAIKHLIGGI
ncbi:MULTISPECIES: phosphoribosylanthranilate isomerase [unclassified Staphylococcus]|uniref:phosphoribosylanthranilate isomerase n=1 Tax=unclassified Staphylococcus TaxID=91994 RepID=UPI0021D0DB25|nr:MULTISPECIES: phosphoribosylanthranilate isomerase [unclassified Staphylococcus]UXR73758.1 phosphoribosylanthranilate isomerase [Staphylococcus sp. IVB6238]UXR76078.1 phosphoribosylanthranilate isomerase [Staphylococcus sp. IVB6233]UXR80276.1 phosphoribosylanthranilate isomerase [Staphylococcus sp. IVB6218]